MLTSRVQGTQRAHGGGDARRPPPRPVRLDRHLQVLEREGRLVLLATRAGPRPGRRHPRRRRLLAGRRGGRALGRGRRRGWHAGLRRAVRDVIQRAGAAARANIYRAR